MALFGAMGGFDERMAACEDYDLWLRIMAEHEVGLLDELLVMRRAGHDDQLSAITPALDRFRILALAKLLERTSLPQAKRTATAKALAEKCEIYANGLSRRGNAGACEFYRGVAENARRRWQEGATRTLGEAIDRMREHLGVDARSLLPPTLAS